MFIKPIPVAHQPDPTKVSGRLFECSCEALLDEVAKRGAEVRRWKNAFGEDCGIFRFGKSPWRAIGSWYGYWNRAVIYRTCQPDA